MLKNNLNKLLFVLLLFAGFTACDDDNGAGPEEMPQSGTFKVTIENTAEAYDYIDTGVFNTPEGATEPGPAFSGSMFKIDFSAGPGMRLSFATMFAQSNDFFYAPGENGIALFDDNGNPVTGDVTSQVMLWDSGTEINQEPGEGADQAPRQSGANTGAADPTNTVRMAPDTYGNLPAVSDVIKVTLSNSNKTDFTLTIENVSGDMTLTTSMGNNPPIPLSPGVWVVCGGTAPLFTEGMADYGRGLEHIAEDGNPAMLADYMEEHSGITHVISPGVYAVHSSSVMLYEDGMADNGTGIENIAEDGDPSMLNSSLSGVSGISEYGVYNTPTGNSSAGPLTPGHTYTFTFDAEEGDYLSLASMLGQTNDIFVGPDDMGIALFDSDGNALNGNITSMFYLWDAGTEVNEKPGIGYYQAPRQMAKNTGPDENSDVMMVNDGYTYPAVSDIIMVTIEEL